MNTEEVKDIANADPLKTAIDTYEIMGSYDVDGHKKNCIEGTLLPMVHKHVEMAKELLKIYEAVGKDE